jgi:2-methylcitrate dehydratase PrpD
LASLIDEHGLDAHDVTSMVAISDRTGTELVLSPLEEKRRPRTPRDAKFSLPYCLAALLVHGRLGPDDFTTAALNDPAVITVAQRVTAELREYPPTGCSTPGGVRVATRYGQSFEIDLLHPRGAIENPMTRADIVAKWRTNAALALSPMAISDLEHALLGLQREPELSPLEILSDVARQRAGVASVSRPRVVDTVAQPGPQAVAAARLRK